MSLFRKESVAMPETTGTDVLRMATKARRQKNHLGILARDLHVSILDLEAFADGGKPLPEPLLQKLAAEFFNARLNDDGLLQSLNTAEVKPMCAANYPPFTNPESSPHYVPPREPGAPLLAPQPVVPEKKVRISRPGWLGGWR